MFHAVSAAAVVAAYAANLGAAAEVERGLSIRPTGTRRCRYCRRIYEGAVPRTCDGCGASEYEPQGFIIESPA